ncbi:MAG: glutathione binding-like protein, partial [Pseudomonadota bacterium]|nr:glutathione binding-like protein [Pseudomonadota bacterium]
PVYPVARAEKRLLIHRIERDWIALVEQIMDPKKSDTAKNKARKSLKDSIITIAPVFSQMDYFMDDEFTIVDSLVAPILWRLSILGVSIEKTHKGLHNYMNRLFERESFQKSLSEFEREIPNMTPEDVTA